MWRKIVTSVVAGILGLTSATALARGPESGTPYRQKKVLEISETGSIVGQLLAPATILSAQRLKEKESSLIEYRFDFTPEIVDTGDKL